MATVAQIIRNLVDTADPHAGDSKFYKLLKLQHNAAVVVQGDYDRVTYVYADSSIIHTGYDHMGWSGVATYKNSEEFTNASGISIRSTTN